MRPNLVLVSGLFVNVRRTVHGKSFNARRQWNGSRHSAACAPNGFDNFTHRLIQDPVIIGFQAYSYLLVHTLIIRLAGEFGDDPFGHRRWHRLIVRKLHGVSSAALSYGAQIRSVAKHLR